MRLLTSSRPSGISFILQTHIPWGVDVHLGIMIVDLLTHLSVKIALFILISMANIRQTVPDSYNIPIKENVQFQGEIDPDKFKLDRMQNGRLDYSWYCQTLYT